MPRPISIARRGAMAKERVRYFVATTGLDTNAGTYALPFLTIQKAHDVAVAGDVIAVRGGTYNLTANLSINRDGTAGKPIVYRNWNKEAAIIDGTNAAELYPAMIMNSANYNHWKGFEIKNGRDGGIMVQGTSTNNTFELLDIHHNGFSNGDGGAGIGLAIYGASGGNLILNCDCHHNYSPASDGGNADGFQIATNGTAGNTLRGCRAWNNSDDGFDFFNTFAIGSGTTIQPAFLDDCHAWHNGYEPDGVTLSGNGNGFKMGGQRSADNFSGGNTTTRCTAWDNRYYGFNENQATLPQTLYNNTAWQNEQGISPEGDEQGTFAFRADGSLIKNNLAHGTGGLVIQVAGSDTHNTWNLAVTVTDADFQSLTPTAITGARNADGTINHGTFLHLAAGSDLINKGTDVGLPFNGASPDLGAYET